MNSLPNNTITQLQKFGIKRQSLFIFIFSLVLFTTSSCKKQKLDDLNKPEGEFLTAGALANMFVAPTASFCGEDFEDVYSADSILKPTILGNRLNGYPYSVSIMQQAAQQILGSSAGVGVNAWYMRFKPSDAEQLAALEDNDIDLFDYPLDYEVIQEGDYYDDGVTPSETIPWLYAVVPVNFIPPAGIIRIVATNTCAKRLSGRKKSI